MDKHQTTQQRLFVGLPVTPSCVVEWEHRIKKPGTVFSENARWTHPDDGHLTLSFIGMVSVDVVNAVSDALSALLAKQTLPTIALNFNRIEPFPDSAPKVLAATAELSSSLQQLVELIADTLQPLGVTPESRPYRPHVTLVRDASNIIASCEAQVLSSEACCFDHLSLYETAPVIGGSRYQVLQNLCFA